MIFNLPDIFHFGDNIRQGYESRYERKIGKDFRNSVLLAPLEESLSNLLDIRTRIGSRIEKEIASGTDMSRSLNALNYTDQALLSTERAVAIATSTVSNDNPQPAYREAQAAYIALNQSRDMLDNVLDTIISDTNEKNRENNTK